jgi:cell wall-associated NlpC family hydrolase
MFGTGTMAMSLGLCLCAGQLVAPQVASAAPVVSAASAVSAVAATRALPKMSQSVNRRTLAKGQLVTLTTKIADPRTGKAATSGQVRLQAYRNGWKTWQTRNVRSGKVVFVSKPSITGYYRTQFLGNDTLRPAVTKRIKVTVKSAAAARVLAEAAKHKGALYLFGAAGPKRFDCSGFTMYVYKKAAGRKLPHKANSQQKYGKAISKANKKPGDLIVFRSGSYGHHAGIYAGGGYMWDSPRSGKRVSKRKMIGSNYVVRRLV